MTETNLNSSITEAFEQRNAKFRMKNPKPGTRAALLTLMGVTIATIGAIILGNLKS